MLWIRVVFSPLCTCHCPLLKGRKEECCEAAFVMSCRVKSFLSFGKKVVFRHWSKPVWDRSTSENGGLGIYETVLWVSSVFLGLEGPAGLDSWADAKWAFSTSAFPEMLDLEGSSIHFTGSWIRSLVMPDYTNEKSNVAETETETWKEGHLNLCSKSKYSGPSFLD